MDFICFSAEHRKLFFFLSARSVKPAWKLGFTFDQQLHSF